MAQGQDDLLAFDSPDGKVLSDEEKKKRKFLYPYQQAPAQLLNPGGDNSCRGATSESWWKLCSKGGKTFPYCYEGVDADAVRQGVGASRGAGAMFDFGEEFFHEEKKGTTMAGIYKDLIKADIYDAAKKEWDVMKVHFDRLNGRNVQVPGSSYKADPRRELFGNKRQRRRNRRQQRHSINHRIDRRRWRKISIWDSRLSRGSTSLERLADRREQHPAPK